MDSRGITPRPIITSKLVLYMELRYISKWEILPVLTPFLDFLHGFLEKRHMTHYCLSIRAQKPNHYFDHPRWHVDHRFFDNNGEEFSGGTPRRGGNKWENELWKAPSNLKLATALVGPGTLFLKDSRKGRAVQKEVERRLGLNKSKKGHYTVENTHVCTSFRSLGCADMAEAVRHELVRELKGMEIVQVKTGEVAIFRVDGYNDYNGEPAMHSEPSLDAGDRVFVHVVPGTEEELKRLVEGWVMEFPRYWCVGVLQELDADGSEKG